MATKPLDKASLIDAYLKEFRWVLKRERRKFIDGLLQRARQRDIVDLVFFFEGIEHAIDKDYAAASNKFLDAIKIDKEVACYWNALGACYRDHREPGKAIEAYKAAIALNDKYPNPWYGLGQIYAKEKKYVLAEENFKKAIDADPKYVYARIGLAGLYRDQKNYLKAEEILRGAISADPKASAPWQSLGNLFREQKENTKAEEAYNKARILDTTDSTPLVGLGNIYSDQKEYSKAEQAYREALELNGQDAYALSCLAFLFRKQREYSKSEEYFRKAVALDEKGYVYPWNGLGILYAEKKEYAKAEECFRKAVQIEELDPNSWRNLGLLFLTVGKNSEAVECFERAYKLAIGQQDQYLASIVETNLKEGQEKVKEDEALKKDKHDRDSLSRLLTDTASMESEVYETQKSFQVFVSKAGDCDENHLYLKVLRRWNSYTPIISDNFYVGKGGGYFLKVGEKGIVIDPGFNFIDNFKGAGHTFDEIDVVVVSHAHNDHTSDLESILTLLSNCNKRRKGLDDFSSEDTVRADIAKARGVDIRSVTEDEIEKIFISESVRRKKIDLYLTKSVEKKFGGMLTSSTKNDYEYHVVEKGDIKNLLKGRLKMLVIEAKHDDIISDRDSVGCAFEFGNAVLIYTGDTGWDGKIERQYARLKTKYKGKTIVLLAHIGGFKDYEMKYLIPEDKGKSFYKNHLGRLGLGRLIEVLAPEICFISEFGEELRKYREKISDIYGAIFKNTQFLPADIGLEYHFGQNKIRAITKLDLENYNYDTGLVNPVEVKTCLLRKDYSLHYFDGNAKLKESDLVQVLIERFDRSSK